MPKKTLNEKRADQADLKRVNRILITLEASEENLQRIAAMLVFATVPYELEKAPPLGPLPWEDPADPRFQKIPELEIDYAAVRRDIMTLLARYVARYDLDAAKDVVRAHGSPDGKVSQVPLENLLPLHNDLHNRLNPETTE